MVEFHPNLKIPTEAEFEALLLERFNLFHKNRSYSTSAKAQDFTDFQSAVEHIMFAKSRQPHVLITINPRPGITYEDFSDKVQFICEKYFHWSIHSYEIRSAPDTGMHAHIVGLIKLQYQNSNFSRIKTNFVPTMCGNAQHVDIRYINDKDVQKSIKYIRKDTTAKSKAAGNLATIAWRKELNIPRQIILGDIPTCLSPDSELIINSEKNNSQIISLTDGL
jgi:hypothetical protein